MTLYVNGDTQEAYTETEILQAYQADVAAWHAMNLDGQSVPFEHWINAQCDLVYSSSISTTSRQGRSVPTSR